MGAGPPSRSDRFRHLVFDLDGTLVDSAGDLVAAANACLADLGLRALPHETIVSFVGEGTRRLVERCVRAANHGAATARVDEALARFLEFYSAHLLDRTEPYAGIPELLEELGGRSIELSVLSNKPGEFSRRILAGLGLAQRFARILGGDDLPHPKPDPRGLERVIAESGVANAGTLVVGDSPIDVRTARAAGVDCCAVAWGLCPREILIAAEPRWLIETPSELLERIDLARNQPVPEARG